MPVNYAATILLDKLSNVRLTYNYAIMLSRCYIYSFVVKWSSTKRLVCDMTAHYALYYRVI